MGNTITNMSETMIQDKVLPALGLAVTPLSAFSMNIGNAPKNVGDVVTVNVASVKTAATYSTTFATGESTTTGTSVTMAAPTFSSWYVDPNTEAAPTPERFLSEGVEAVKIVAKTVYQAVLAKFIAANIGSASTDTTIVAAADYDSENQADLWGQLKTKGVTGNISAIHNIAYATNILKDAKLTDKSASGSSVMTTGELPSILGVRQFYTDAFPTVVTNESTGVIYTGSETAAVALTVPQSVEAGLENAAGVRIALITDPASGLSFVWRTWMDANTGWYWGSVYVMHGQSFVRDSAVRLTSA